jgi:acetyl-CoA C-acetyltransferase
MWEEVARAAADDTGVSGVLDRVGSVDVVYCQSWEYDNAVDRLAERLGIDPAARRYSGIGGSVPQSLAVEAAGRCERGELDVALVVGGEALATVRRLKKAGERPQWSHRSPERRPFPMDPLDPAEISHSIFEAYLTFALFDSAERAHAGRSLEEHRQRCGRMLAPMSEVAASDPANAWFPVARTAEELITPTADNRMVAYPYTKTMVAIMDVDMSAAVLVASDAAADELGVPVERRVHLRGAGYAEDPATVAARTDLWRSQAMTAALSGLGAERATHFDLYSCFASSLTFATNALDLPPGTPLTVTGGLPYHGGPGSNYVTHSLAAMAERLRADPGSFGLVSGVGMHMAKHSFGLWSTEPGPVQTAGAPPPVQQTVGITATAEGPATVAAYTVLHGRDGGPDWAPLICDLPDGTRCYARLDAPDDLARGEAEELIGQAVNLTTDGGVNRASCP